MEGESKPIIKRFPLRLKSDFSEEIDSCVFYSNAPSKHQYIIEAIREKVERDKVTYKKSAIN
jgi:hypothetical protein